jgi:hypothetical protein
MSAELVRGIKELDGLNYSEIAEWFNFTPLIDNPLPEGTVPDPVTIPELLGLTTPERAIQLMGIPAYRDAVNAYNTGAFADALAYINVMHDAKVITDSEYAAVLTELGKTMPDPNYQKQVTGSPRYLDYGFMSSVTAEQVQGWLN